MKPLQWVALIGWLIVLGLLLVFFSLAKPRFAR